MTPKEIQIVRKGLDDIGKVVAEKLPKDFGVVVVVTEMTKDPTVLHYSNMPGETTKLFLLALANYVDGGAFDA